MRRERLFNSERRTSRWAAAVTLGCGVWAIGVSAGAATIEIVNVDAAGTGLNDPTPVAPIGGNPGTTLGEQRQNVIAFAAQVFSERLESDVTIRIEASFPDLACGGSGVLLGQGGAFDAFRNFSGALPNVWYGAALADAIAGTDNSPGDPDIQVQFNAALDNAVCLGSRGWYYGFDELNGDEPNLTRAVVHEMGHGFGFQTFSSVATGDFFGGSPDIYSVFTFDVDEEQTWANLSAGQRVISAKNYLNVGWVGDNAVAAMAGFATSGTPLALASSPASAPPSRSIWVANTSFAPTAAEAPAEGLLIAAFDGSSNTSDGCEALVTAVSGRIVLLDEGSCDPGVQVENAEDAGAIGLLIAGATYGATLDELDGSAVGTPAIPVGKIRREDSDWLRLEMLGNDVKIKLLEDQDVPLGAHPDGFPLLYTPDDVAPGSSVSHWSVRFEPSLLMEPFADGGSPDEPDLTIPLLQDLGWQVLSGSGGGAGVAGAADGGGSAGGGGAGSGGAAGAAGASGATGGGRATPPAASLAPPSSGGGCSVVSGSRGRAGRFDLGVGIGILGLAFFLRIGRRRRRRHAQ